MSETITEYGVRLPDGTVETDWDLSLADARDEARETPGAVVVKRTVTRTEWTKA